ncbi:hypothetical protein ABG067_001695 [Albugo candida]
MTFVDGHTSELSDGLIIQKYLKGAHDHFCFDVNHFSPENEFKGTHLLKEWHSYHSMEKIYGDLKRLQSILETQLVSIINQDYSEFLHLSLQLKGIDEAVTSLQQPLSCILERVYSVQENMQELKQQIVAKAEKLQITKKEEEELVLSVKISAKLSLIEDLLETEQISEVQAQDSGGDGEESGYIGDIRAVTRCNNDSNQVCARLERVAGILVDVEHDMSFGKAIQAIQREGTRHYALERALYERLETELVTEISPDSFYQHNQTLDPQRLGCLLRAYAILQNTRIAEETIATLVVKPVVEDLCSRGRKHDLEEVYNQILGFITRKFGSLLTLPVCQARDRNSVDLMGNVIWKTIYQTLKSKFGDIFESTEPGCFHRNYVVSMTLWAQLEALIENDCARWRFRTSSKSLAAFMMEAEFICKQMRRQEFSERLERKMESNHTTAKTGDENFYFTICDQLWMSVEACWSENVFLSALSIQFLQLTIELIQSFTLKWSSYVDHAIAQISAKTKVFSAPLSSESDIFHAASDFHLLRQRIQCGLVPLILSRLKTVGVDSDTLEQLIEEPLDTLSGMERMCWSAAAIVVADDCKKILPAIRSVKGQYQMTNRASPTAPSIYVSSIIRPLNDFMAQWGTHFHTNNAKKEFFASVLRPVCQTFDILAVQVIQSAAELERSLKHRKAQRQGGREGTESLKLSDTEKMQRQLILDLEALKSEAEALSFDLCDVDTFQHALEHLKAEELR